MTESEKRMRDKDLYDIAESARAYSYCPYSGISVGAALHTDDGRVYLGSNIENSAYSPGVCAERVAIFKAVSEGKRRFKAIAVAGGRVGERSERAFPPCGVCRQVMEEFCDADLEIILKDGDSTKSYRLGELLPLAFGTEELG